MSPKLVMACCVLVTFLLGGCASVPEVKLNREVAQSIQSIRIISKSENSDVLQVFSSVSLDPAAMDELGVRPWALAFMEYHDIRFADIVRQQFEQELIDSGIPLRVDPGSSHILRITVNVVGIGMKHGFSRELNCRFNIAGELFSPDGELLWSYNSIPISPIAPGYPLTPEEMFDSKEAFVAYLEAGSIRTVEKLFKNFAQAYK